MDRHLIIERIGKNYLVSNLENEEFSYPKALKSIGKMIDDSLISTSKGKKHQYLDIRFVKDNISILVETKNNFDKWNTQETLEQLQAYVNYEKTLTGNKIIAILANTEDDRVKVWWGSDLTIDESHQIKNQYSLKTFDEYANLYTSVQNDKEKVLRNTYALNEVLHKYGVGEKIRSQFIGTCLLSLKSELLYENLTTKQILGGVEETITKLLEPDLNKMQKLVILKTKVLDSQDVRDLKKEELQEILRNIESNIAPYIDEKSTMGQDILNLFFTTFNKYVGKADKNQAFTPDHIVHFMCQAVGVNRNSKVLDPCCGSGAFLVRAMTDALDDCANDAERDGVKKRHIYGIEYEETAFGLATTNMLIHGDGNSNVKQGSCFELESDIRDSNIDIVLMNPPYNAQRKHSKANYVKNWSKDTKQDPSKGFHYVHYIASIVGTGKLAVLLPMQCAIGGSKDIKRFKDMMLQEHTLDAVFSLPADVFHPGATASACCMIFNLGTRHEKVNQDTFFGYFKDDGFLKKKNLGRVEKTKLNSNEGVWADIESKWLHLYRTRKSVAGLSATQKVDGNSEWLPEAYMETDYSNLTDAKFEKVVRDFFAFKVFTNQPVSGSVGTVIDKDGSYKLNSEKWKYFEIDVLFPSIMPTKGITTNDLIQGDEIPYIAAKKDINGLELMCSKEGNEQFISKGNCIVFIQLGAGSVGYVTYQENNFIGMNGKTTCGYNNKLNKYNALFLVTILDLERPKYSYGRSWTGERLEKTKIKLPVDFKGNPDWQFMEGYIKSLPYSANL